MNDRKKELAEFWAEMPKVDPALFARLSWPFGIRELLEELEAHHGKPEDEQEKAS